MSAPVWRVVGRPGCATIAGESVRVLIDYRPALIQRTGVGEWVHSLVSALADAHLDNLELTVFSSSWKDRLKDTPATVRPVDRRVPVTVLNYCWHRLGWPPVEWLAGSGYDVVHSPHPLLIPTRAAAQIVTIHDLDFLDHPDRTENEVRRDYPALVPGHARRAAHVVVPSRYTAREVERRLGVPAEQISICYNGAPSWSPRVAWPTDGHILFVGSLAARKNIGRLLEAYRELVARDTAGTLPPLVLAGPPTTDAAEWLAMIEHPPFLGRVHCTGYLEKADLKALYEKAAVLVLPSLHEGFGLPAVEAMTIGVPVVVSNRGALPEVVDEAGLIVEPTDTAALVAAIDRMLHDEPFSRACVERGFQQAAQYSWTRSAETLTVAYQRAYTHRSST